MFYLKAKAPQELSEIVLFESTFGRTLPYFAEFDSDDGKALQLVETIEFASGGGEDFLLWNPNVATWCFVDSEELEVCRELANRQTIRDLSSKFPEYRPAGLLRFVTHLYRRGMLRVNGEAGIAPDIYSEGPLARKGTLVELYMTERCNMACKYCFAEAALQNSTMPLEIGYLAIDKAFAVPSRSLIIEFAGGETYLEFDTFRKLVKYIEFKTKRTGRKPVIAVQSNGTMYHKPEIRKFMIDHGIPPGVSVDGPPAFHDGVRPLAGGQGSSNPIWKGIESLQSSGFTVPVLTTVSRANVGEPEQVVDYFLSKGIQYGMFKEILQLGRAEGSWDDLAVKPEEFFQFIRRFLEHTTGKNLPFRDLTTKRLMSNLLFRTRDTRCMRAQCGAGYDYFVIRPNGDVYPCADYVLPNMKMGNVTDPRPLEQYAVDLPVLVEMESQRRVNNIEGCRECSWRHLCEGECGLNALKHHGTLYSPSPKCGFYKNVYPYLLRFSRRHPEVVCDYVEDIEQVVFDFDSPDEGESEKPRRFQSFGASLTRHWRNPSALWRRARGYRTGLS